METFFSPFRDKVFAPSRAPSGAPVSHRGNAWHARLAALACLGLLAMGAGQARAWSLDDVAGLARERAQTPFKPAAQAMPAELANLDYDGYRDIRFNPASTVWRADKLPYEVNFFHIGRDRKSTRLNSSHIQKSRMPSSA